MNGTYGYGCECVRYGILCIVCMVVTDSEVCLQLEDLVVV